LIPWQKVRLRALVVLKTSKILCLLCPIWIFGPLVYVVSRSDVAPHNVVDADPRATGSGRVNDDGTEKVVVDTLGLNDTLSDVFLRHNLNYSVLLRVIKASNASFDLNQIPTESVVRLMLGDGNRFKGLEYEIDERRTLIVRAVAPDSMDSRIEEVDYKYRQRLIRGRIKSSLYQTIYDEHEDIRLAYLLSDIFAWQIDFSTDLRNADQFSAVVEEYWARDGIPRLKTVVAAEFYNKGRLFQAFRYQDPAGHIGYYDGTGASLRRKFLKSPLHYTRISSRFSYHRFHPILKVYRPHLGVDYAAPPGTPVVTVGDGKVVYAGWQKGFGRFIKIRHNGTYQTTYGHLRAFAKGIRKGAVVRQGQVIGYVGSTGLATGPHLDFRLILGGNYVNPLTVNLPAGDPVPRRYMKDFRNLVLAYIDDFDTDAGPVLAYSEKSSDSSPGQGVGVR